MEISQDVTIIKEELITIVEIEDVTIKQEDMSNFIPEEETYQEQELEKSSNLEYSDDKKPFTKSTGNVKKPPNPCHLCQKVFSRKYGLNKHMRNVHKVDNTRKEVRWNDHNTPTQVKGEFQCEVCFKNFSNYRNMLQHLKISHPDVKSDDSELCRCDKCLHPEEKIEPRKRSSAYAKCNVCKHLFDTRSNLQRHFKKVHPHHQLYVEYKCPDCSEFFESRDDVKAHVNEVHTEKTQASRKVSSIFSPNVKCNVCGIVFTKKYSLERHFERLHPGFEVAFQYSCFECNELFDSSFEVKIHRQKAHQDIVGPPDSIVKRLPRNEKKSYTCQECNLSFSQKVVYLKHMSLSLHKPRLKCQHCHERFPDQTALLKHSREKHTSSIQNEDDDIWKTMEKDIINGKCMVCNEDLNQIGEIKNHFKLKHMGRKPEVEFTCPDCGKVFKTLGSYRIHEQTHNNETFECKICKKRFSRRKILEKHSKYVHELNTVNLITECYVCAMGFESTTSYEHFKSYHPGFDPKIDLSFYSYESDSDEGSTHFSESNLRVKVEPTDEKIAIVPEMVIMEVKEELHFS